MSKTPISDNTSLSTRTTISIMLKTLIRLLIMENGVENPFRIWTGHVQLNLVWLSAATKFSAVLILHMYYSTI